MDRTLVEEINLLHAQMCQGLADPTRILILYFLARAVFTKNYPRVNPRAKICPLPAFASWRFYPDPITIGNAIFSCCLRVNRYLRLRMDVTEPGHLAVLRMKVSLASWCCTAN